MLESLINNAAGLQPCNFIKETPAQLFFCEYCEIFKNSFFYRAPYVLWAITTLNFNRVLGNLRTINNFNFTDFFSYRVIGYFMEGASYCCFRKVVSNYFFQQVLLINIIITYANLLQRFILALFLLIEDYGKCTLQ